MSTRTSSERLRVALIGYGLAGSVFHAPLISTTPGMEVAAIVTGNAERQRLAREHFPDAHIYAQVEDVWREAAQYHLVVVATANASHVPLGIAALQAGLPVVIDKPLAATVADAERVIAASKESGKLLTVFQNRRWDNDFLTVRKLFTSNLLGQVTRFESRFERYRPTPRKAWRESNNPADAGGQLYDLGSHLIDQALVLFGKPERVYAEMYRRRPGVQVDDDTFIALSFAHDVQAHLWVSQVAPVSGPRFRVSGLNGSYEKWGLDPQEDALRAGARPEQANWGIEAPEKWGRISTYTGEDRLHLDGTVESVPGAYEHYYAQVREALTTGGPAPVDPGSVVEVIRVIAAAQTSAREGRVVSLT